ncbi:hypothetical protein BJ508DRAFT_315057 [Ascobolus immersus RN42]|uniref:Uncharacterized protein n=1 Tax=Ascobolus immersus RN42 TaxID=1160509 RepID=A0A3N4HCK5_ASCIM|nr:hypothetical protein BJ508DRAFT_315057 [Ascobolus immersus RN42]
MSPITIPSILSDIGTCADKLSNLTISENETTAGEHDISYFGGSDTSMEEDDNPFDMSGFGSSLLDDSVVHDHTVGTVDSDLIENSNPFHPFIVDADGLVDGLEPEFAFFLHHGLYPDTADSSTSVASTSESVSDFGNPGPDVNAGERGHVETFPEALRISEDMAIFSKMKDSLTDEMIALDRLSRMCITDQIAITSIFDPVLCRQLLGEHACHDLFKHKGYSVFDHYAIKDEQMVFPSVGLRLRFSSMPDGNGGTSTAAEYYHVSWDDAEESHLFKVGVIQRFDFDGYDLMMLLRRDHFIIGNIVSVNVDDKSGKVTFAVEWESGPNCRV